MNETYTADNTGFNIAMAASRQTVRLFVSAPLSVGADVVLDRDQTHRLRNVMRCKPGDTVRLFNGRDGEWQAIIGSSGKRAAIVEVSERIEPQWYPPDLWLLFAPVKRGKVDDIAARATELGVSQIQPVLTDHTNVSRVDRDRLVANAVETAEQCGLLSVPEVHAATSLSVLLDDWPLARRIMVCDESGTGPPAAPALGAGAPDGAPWAVLIGPEGGFSSAERARLHAMPQTLAVSLGPRIMRAGTAAIAALSVWQSVLGDWHRAGKFDPANGKPPKNK